MAALDVELGLANDSDAHPLAEFSRDLIEAGLGWSYQPERIASLIDDPDVAPGRYRLRPRAVSALVTARARIPVPAGSSFSWAEANGQTAGHTVASEHDTMTSRPDVPCLRLLTRDAVTETRRPGALAGRGTAAELKLPDDLTVSRVHAEFSYADGHWQVANRGRNGLRLNGKAVSGQQAVADGDLIHWGHQADALTSLVQIGPQP